MEMDMTRKSFAAAGRALAVVLVFLLSVVRARAGEKVILRFNETHGAQPYSGLTSDGVGNLYGTTFGGGKNNCGTAFELSPAGSGAWTETVLYSFQGCLSAGLVPYGTMLFDKQGNLYGAEDGEFGSPGAIFELSKGTDGIWSGKVIYQFARGEGSPNGDLTWDSAGNLYGTADSSYYYGGEVFELSKQPGGSWKETVVYTFPSPGRVAAPTAGVIFDSKGNLYGPAHLNGTHGYTGVVYELSPQANGPWTLTVIYDSRESSYPDSRLVFDSSGNLYGTATDSNHGQVFELSPAAGATWTEKAIYHFVSGNDASQPQAPLIMDSGGNLYGTSTLGGRGCNQNSCGVVYKLSPQSDGTWKENTLHEFESATDGSQPLAGLFLDESGNLFGTTFYGGSRYGYGTVFEITP
jgi:uncharacterized repeat protein (TIGR03803 family)